MVRSDVNEVRGENEQVDTAKVVQEGMKNARSVVALVDVGTGKESLIIPIAITAERKVDGTHMDVNVISSAYEKNATALVNEAIAKFNTGEDSIFYIKKEAANLLRAGVQYPQRLKAVASSDGIVRKFDTKVNMSVKNVTQSQQFKHWFGDWQNHPERASKGIENAPAVIYNPARNAIIYLTGNKNRAQEYIIQRSI